MKFQDSKLLSWVKKTKGKKRESLCVSMQCKEGGFSFTTQLSIFMVEKLSLKVSAIGSRG